MSAVTFLYQLGIEVILRNLVMLHTFQQTVVRLRLYLRAIPSEVVPHAWNIDYSMGKISDQCVFKSFSHEHFH